MKCKYCGGSLEFSLVSADEGTFCSDECLYEYIKYIDLNERRTSK